MKILVVSHMFPSENNPVSGIYVQQQVEELRNQGCEVKVVSPVPWTPFPSYLISEKWAGYHQIPSEGIIGNVKVIYPRYLVLPRNWLLARSGRMMYRGIITSVNKLYKTFPFDIIHAHSALPDGFAAMKLAKHYQKPFLLTIHGRDMQQTVNMNSRCKGSISQVLRKADKTIFVSKKLKISAQHHFGNSNKYLVISNGIDPQSIISSSKQINQRETDQLTILSVSNLIQTKGINHNLLAIKKLINSFPNLRYQVIGKGNQKNALINLSEKLGIQDIVTFLGQLPNEIVMQYMANCNVFSLPSWKEGFGLVYLEAMAHGKPVIGCRGEGIEDFVVDGKTGLLVEPHNIEQLVDAMAYLLENPAAAKRMGDQAKTMVLDKYTWEKSVEKLISIYQEVISKGS